MRIFAVFAMWTCASPEVDFRVVTGKLNYDVALCASSLLELIWLEEWQFSVVPWGFSRRG